MNIEIRRAVQADLEYHGIKEPFVLLLGSVSGLIITGVNANALRQLARDLEALSAPKSRRRVVRVDLN